MSEENKTITINTPNSLDQSAVIVSPVPEHVQQMMERSISTPDAEVLLGRTIQLRIDGHRLAEREDKEFLAQLKKYHGRRFSDEW